MSVSPLVALWKDVLSDHDQTDADTDWLATASVPVTNILDVVECRVALIGNAFNLISQTRSDALLSAVHKDLKRYATQDEIFSDTQGCLFGEEFRSTLESRVSAESALSKVAEVFVRQSPKAKLSNPIVGRFPLFITFSLRIIFYE